MATHRQEYVLQLAHKQLILLVITIQPAFKEYACSNVLQTIMHNHI